MAALLLVILLTPGASAQDADLDLNCFAIGTPRAGEIFHYEYDIANLGPDPAANVSLRDFLPDEVEVVNAFLDPDGDGPINPEPIGITMGSNAIFCSLGDIPVTAGAGTLVFINVRIRPNVPAGTVLTNNADVFLSDATDPDFLNNSDSSTVTVQTTADVAIDATASANPVIAGDILTHDVGVSNLGPSDAQDVVVFDVLPDEAEALLGTAAPTAFGGAGAPSGRFVPNCTQPPNLVGLRAVLSGANEVPPVVAPADPSGVATFVLNTDTNELIYSIEVSDISSTITASHIHLGAAGVNGAVEVTLFNGGVAFDSSKPLVGAVNIGAGLATDIAADPAGYYVNVHTTGFPDGEIRGQLAQTANTPVRCEVGTVAANAEVTFSLPALVAPNARPLSEIHNVAIVTSATNDISNTRYNNVAGTDTVVDTLGDLQVTQVGAKSASVQAGDVFTYSIFVDNFGPSFASGVSVGAVIESTGTFDLIDVTSDRDTGVTLAPGGGPFAVAASSLPPPPPPPPFGVVAPTGVANVDRHIGFTCNLTGGDDPLLAGSLGVLNFGNAASTGRWTLVVRVRARNAQTINSVVNVAADTADPFAGNNQALHVFSVLNTADLGITKVATAGPVVPGDTITYDITVENFGPSPASSVVIEDVLPAELEVVSASGLTPGGGAAACAGGTPGNPQDPAACFLGTMLAGETGSMTIEARVRGSVALDPLTGNATIHNGARVLSDTFDPENNNNLASTFTTVECATPGVPANLSASDGTEFQKIVLVWDAVPGATRYTVYRNTGANFATAQMIGSATDTTYTDYYLGTPPSPGPFGCNPGTNDSFTYWVKAVNSCGESPPSAPDEGQSSAAKSASFVPAPNQAGDLMLTAVLLMGLVLLRMRHARKIGNN